MTFEIFYRLALTQTYLSAVLAVLCLYRYKSRSVWIRLIGFTFLLGFIADQAVLILGKLHLNGYKVNAYYNIPPVIWSLCNIPLLAAAYYFLMDKKYKLLFILAAGLSAIVTSSNVLLYQKGAFNSYSIVFQAMIVIDFCVVYFYKLLQELPEQHIHKLPMFWINSGLLIFYSGTFILYTFTSYLTEVLKNDMITYWSFHNILRIFLQLLILVGLYYDLMRLKKINSTS